MCMYIFRVSKRYVFTNWSHQGESNSVLFSSSIIFGKAYLSESRPMKLCVAEEEEETEGEETRIVSFISLLIPHSFSTHSFIAGRVPLVGPTHSLASLNIFSATSIAARFLLSNGSITRTVSPSLSLLNAFTKLRKTSYYISLVLILEVSYIYLH